MSKLAAEWLQKTFKVSRPLDPMERALSDGYVFANILHQGGYIDEFEYEAVRSDKSPETALGNFKIVARALKKLQIKVTKADVANLISEQSGCAPILVMEIKKAIEVGGKPRVIIPEYKKAIKTNRDRTYTREQDAERNLDPESKYLNNVVKTNPNLSEYRTATVIGLQKDYEVFRLTVDEKERLKEEALIKDAIISRGARIQQQFARDRELVVAHRETAKTLVKNWRDTQLVKHDRLVRDTQFELAVQAHKNLKSLRQSQLHTQEEMEGIDSFEYNLKRSGLGGADDGRPLAVSYEDSEAFVERLEELTMAKMPTKEETSDFLSTLKARTAESRIARLEKARRRRRMLNEQNGSVLSSLDRGADEECGSLIDNTTQEMQKRIAKEERDAQLTDAARESREKMMDIAEEKLRVFFESYRLLSDDAGDRPQKYREVLAAQEERRQMKRNIDAQYVKTVVFEIVKLSFNHLGLNSSSVSSEVATDGDDFFSYSQIVDGVKNLLGVDASDNNIHVQEGIVSKHPDSPEFTSFASKVVSLDMWSSVAAVASNIGKFRLKSEFKTAKANESRTVEPTASSDQKEGGTDHPVPVTASSSTSASESSQEAGDAFSLESSSMLIESLKNVCETMLTSSAKNITEYNHMKLSAPEASMVNRKDKTSIIVILGQGNIVSQNVWESSISPIGGTDVVEIWDILNALEAAEKFGPMMTGKNPVIKATQLASVYLFGRDVQIPENFANVDIPANSMKVVSEVIDSYTKVSALIQSVSASTFKSLSDLTFDDVYLFALLGQVLWLRETLCELWRISTGGTCPMPSTLLVSRSYGRGLDSPQLLKVFDWFLKGGGKDNIPDSEPELKAFAAASFEKYDGKKKPPAKAKGAVEQPIPEASSISAIVWIKSDNLAAAMDLSVYNTDEKSTPTHLTLKAYEDLKRTSPIPYDAALANEEILLYAQNHGEILFVPCHFERDSSAKGICISQHSILCEVMLCLILNIKETSSFTENGSGVGVGLISEAMKKRRLCLMPEESILLQHSSGENVLDVAQILSLLASVYSNKAQEVCYLGAVFLSTFDSIWAFKSKLRVNEAALVADLKATDPRWETLCKDFGFGFADDIEMKIHIDNIVCNLGDTLDERHMNWCTALKSIEIESAEAIQDICEKLIELCKLAALSLIDAYKVQRKIVLEFVRMLEAAGYSTFPWVLSTASMKGGRVNIQRRRDELKALCLSIDILEGSNLCQSWFSFLGADLLSDFADDISPIQQDAIYDLNICTLNRALCISKAYSTAIRRYRDIKHSYSSYLKETILRRHLYEHDCLRRFEKDLRLNASTLTGKSIGASVTKLSVSSYQIFFKPSIDEKDDAVLYRFGKGALELGEMTLPVEIIYELALVLANMSGSNIFEMIKAALDILTQNNVEFSYLWNINDKIASFLMDFNIIDKRSLIITLLLGVLPRSFSDGTVMLIIKLLEQCKPDSGSEDSSMHAIPIKAQMLTEKLLQSSQFFTFEYGNFADMYLSAVKAFVVFNSDAEKFLLPEDLLYCVCSSVVLSEVREFECSLLCYNSEEDSNRSCIEFLISSLPELCAPGLMKAIAASNAIVGSSASPSNSIILNRLLGPSLNSKGYSKLCSKFFISDTNFVSGVSHAKVVVDPDIGQVEPLLSSIDIPYRLQLSMSGKSLVTKKSVSTFDTLLP